MKVGSNAGLNAPAEKNRIKYILQKVKKLRIDDLTASLKLLITFIPGKVWRITNGSLCVVSEYEYLARDNGYWFFKHLRENHPEVPAYYPIARGCYDEERLLPLGNIIPFGGLKHCMLFWAASRQFTSSKNAGLPSRVCEELVLFGMHRFEYVLLNHGFTRGKSPVVDPQKTNFDYICTCSVKDRDIIVRENGQSPERVVLTGFARHDNLTVGEADVERRSIVIMPTWRSWLNAKYANDRRELLQRVEDFLTSDYYHRYQSLLNNPDLLSFAEANGVNIHFYLHDNAQYFARYFDAPSDAVTIELIGTADLQGLLKEGSLLITDYSSVCYDFAYMQKPVMYYQFDRELFDNLQYGPGESFSYERDGMGPVFTDEGELVSEIRRCAEGGYVMPSIYAERELDFFEFHDKSNCDRIYHRFFDDKTSLATGDR